MCQCLLKTLFSSCGTVLGMASGVSWWPSMAPWPAWSVPVLPQSPSPCHPYPTFIISNHDDEDPPLPHHVNDDHVDHPDHDLFSQVAQCAGCNVYEPWAAMVIGAGAAFVYLCIHTLMIRWWFWWSGDKYCKKSCKMQNGDFLFRSKLDDPLDAVAVHGGGGRPLPRIHKIDNIQKMCEY